MKSALFFLKVSIIRKNCMKGKCLFPKTHLKYRISHFVSTLSLARFFHISLYSTVFPMPWGYHCKPLRSISQEVYYLERPRLSFMGLKLYVTKEIKLFDSTCSLYFISEINSCSVLKHFKNIWKLLLHGPWLVLWLY